MDKDGGFLTRKGRPYINGKLYIMESEEVEADADSVTSAAQADDYDVGHLLVYDDDAGRAVP
ncbi:hypothetical protein PRECH8_13170 [Insulibacter thermoxylanivorax]|uniref:Uncharacterized protein n=1 Tax=Insulibacter thermoxylanivorax TaxID=2749268 RepID=A0A916QC45_9BACL|nr:hypothetical protein PRECH8_13170 [Insulibacter thermoxylanivorax]